METNHIILPHPTIKEIRLVMSLPADSSFPGPVAGLLRRSALLVATVSALVLIGGCAGSADKPDPTATWTVEQLYSTAKDDMDNDRWSDARKHLTAVESRPELTNGLANAWYWASSRTASRNARLASDLGVMKSVERVE